MKVLILSCNTGQGHNSAGRAILEEFSKRGIHADMRDALAFDSEFTSKVVSGIHAKCSVHAPKLWGASVNVARLMDAAHGSHSACYLANMPYAGSLYDFILENGYDTILIPHVFPSEALTRIRRKHAEARNIKVYFVATDYAYPYFLHDTDLDGYFIPHADLVDEFAASGLSRDKIIPVGIPVASTFAVNTDKAEARNRLGLPADKKLLLIMTGSMGFGHTETLVKALLEKCDQDTMLLVMGGNNTRMKARLRTKYQDEERLQVLDFTREVSLYMDACDLLFTKPGGLSSTEAAVKRIPFLHTEPIPGWEEDNIRFFRSRGLSDHGTDAEELALKALYLLANPHRCEQMCAAQAANINRYAARDICDFVLKGATICSG